MTSSQASGAQRSHPQVSVVVPAHDEAGSLRRNLPVLMAGAPELELVVACNGCTDDSAAVAREVAPAAQVLDLPEPSKAGAVAAGNDVATVFPRVHLDADVALSGDSVRALVRPLLEGRALASAPRRVLDLDGAHPVVRWYYRVWEQLPQVRTGLFGRGAFALSEEGQRRVSSLPRMTSDDLVASEAFAPHERVVVDDAVVVVRGPRTVEDLLRRRVRVVVGNRQADEHALRQQGSSTGVRTLLGIAVQYPHLAPKVPVFLAVTLLARRRARRLERAGEELTWQRDESSRDFGS